MKKIIATVEIWKEGEMFTAYCPEFDGTLNDFLAEAGYVVEDEVLKIEKKIVGFEELSISVGV